MIEGVGAVGGEPRFMKRAERDAVWSLMISGVLDDVRAEYIKHHRSGEKGRYWLSVKLKDMTEVPTSRIPTS